MSENKKSYADKNPLTKSGDKKKIENPIDPRFERAGKKDYAKENPYKGGK